MMQPAPVLFTLGLLGAFKMAFGNEVVEEHTDLTDGTGILDVPAGLDAVALANSKWPATTVTKTMFDTETETPKWTTLTTAMLTHPHLKNAPTPTVTVPFPSIADSDPSELAVNIWASIIDLLPPIFPTDLDKRAESTAHISTVIQVVQDAKGHKRTSTKIVQKPFSTVHTSTLSSSTGFTSFVTPVTIPKDIHLVSRSKHTSTSTHTTTVRPGKVRIAAPSITGHTTTIAGQTIVIPQGIETVSQTTVKPRTKTTKVHAKTTTTVPAKGAIIVFQDVHSTRTATPKPISVNPHDNRNHHLADQGQPPVVGGEYWPCHKSWDREHCIPFSKKWLWLLTIPVVLLLASVPLCIYACMRFGRRASRGEKTDYVPAAAPMQQTTATAPAQTSTVVGDGGRQAEEGRAHAPTDHTVTQTVTKAPDGKITTVPGTPAPTSTVQHVETVTPAPHDGAGSFDAGSPRGRNPGRSAQFLRF